MLLRPEDKTRIERAIAEVEAHTAGELVVLVLDESDTYAGPRAALATVLTVLVAWLVAFFVPAAFGTWLLLLQVPVGYGFFRLFGWSPLLRWLVPAPVREAAVLARAEQLFLEHGLVETRDRSGVLLVISEAEHVVQLLADRGIHERAGVEEWQHDVRLIVERIREGRAADGVCEAVARIGAQLATAFPPRPDDRNELSNRVIRVQNRE